MLARVALLLLFIAPPALAAPSLSGPASAGIGSEITVNVSGSSNPRDFVTIVPKAAAEGSYDHYRYVENKAALKLQVPSTAGDYELRLLAAESPYKTLVRQPLKATAVAATLDAPAQVAAGARFEIQWTGPNNERDYIAIGDAKRAYIVYAYTNQGSPAKLVAPDAGGDYELRYILGHGDQVLATRKLTIGSVSATVTAPAQVAAGAKIAVSWQGPNNARDFITLVKAGAPARSYAGYTYTSKGNPVQLMAPDQPGDYEIRYLTGQAYATLATTKITVGPVTATLQAPAEAIAGSTFAVNWQGPNNAHDYITIVAKGAKEGAHANYRYTSHGNPAKLLAPLQAGEYELRYSTGQSHATLGRAAIKITPAKQKPGQIQVTASDALSAGGGIEIILDASGSMLQKIGAQRRIDIAKQTLTQLTSTSIPAGTPFALRVFGREVDSCQTDLDIALTPLDAKRVATKISALEAKNNARTPIGASLEKVTSDLAGVKGERLVVLLTDGEETCGGDPAAAIAQLKKGGITVRVNIVGFAIDDPKLAATFRHWAELGSGSYFDAKDATGLNDALKQSMRPGFEVVTAQGAVVASGVAGGDAVSVLPGNYTVRIKGQTTRAQPVTVEPETTATVKL